jgi:hypothetical protein
MIDESMEVGETVERAFDGDDLKCWLHCCHYAAACGTDVGAYEVARTLVECRGYSWM